MAKKAQIVGFLVLLGLSSLFSIQVLAEGSDNSNEADVVEYTYDPAYGTISIQQLIQAELDQISNAESSGQMSPSRAQQLRLEIEGIMQETHNVQLAQMQFLHDKIINELNATEQEIQNSMGR